ncbi:plastocyanin [Halalkaliarchaeum desulfuricum]|uniref:Plastocyanin n=1 Tax=Halalkaliarchaeum desulfuricum TaxID=2055893 RepID=A0A343TJF0_9EURY|nr:plastocyanin/azurin family copper-binding protein [Halalkaliarchaeum desulfuricum]AUX09222.1 plastocyanin [Halalkaliarchaeum desulfuricum]
MIREQSGRRRFLTVMGTTATVGLAGCVGGDEEPAEEETGEEEHDEEEDHDDDEMEDDHDHGVDHDLGHPVDEFTVEMASMEGAEHFMPHVLHIEVGGTVTWEIADDLEAHDSTAYHPLYDKPLRIPDEDEHWQSPEMDEQGATWERTFDVEGVYDYFCGPHYEDEMIGRVIVGWPDPDPEEQPALAPPEDELLDIEKEMIEMFNENTIPVLEDGNGH